MDGSGIEITAVLAPKVTFATHQNSVPVLRELKVENRGEEPLNDVVVEIGADPPILLAKRWPIDRIAAASSLEVGDLDVALNAELLLNLHEAISATVTITLSRAETVLAHCSHPLEALAQTEWGGAAMPELLAAFVMPNDPVVDTVLKDAAQVLVRAGKSDALDGYNTGSATRVWEVASAVWSAVAGRALTYTVPPAKFETQGQKIRPPSAILAGGLATCLDTACLFAAVLEQAGLNSMLVLTQGHAFTGVWLQPAAFPNILTDEAAAIRRRIALQELVLFETTLATNKPPPAFSVAVDTANRQIAEEKESQFVLALDLKRARMQRLRPLALRLAPAAEGAAGAVVTAEALEEAPPLPSFARPEVEPPLETGTDRLQYWRRKLLDLTLRNRLLNVRPTKTAMRLICPDIARLEDRLAAGAKIKIVAAPAMDAAGRDADLHARRTGEQLLEVYAREALERDEVLSPLGAKDLEAARVELYRKARLDLQEGGANTLFLAIGFLSWKREAEDARSFRAPLILVPVTLERKTARSDICMAAHDDKARFNGTLLELLRQDFELRVLDGFEQELPTDDTGVDVSRILTEVRRAVRDMAGFEVVDEVMIGAFSFAKYLMWKDLTDRTAQLMENRVVRHLLERPRDPFPTGAEIPRPDTLDDSEDPSKLFTPLPADSTQLAAVVASARGCDFVLDGPPGTGKSQTIANIIAHNLALGRKVLFVAEKMAALKVVYSRLEHQGLGAFCLELHSNKANKADVVRQLGRAWDTLEDSPTEAWARDAQELKAIRDELNSLVRLLHRPQAGGVSLYQAIGRVVRDGGPRPTQFSWSADRGVSELDLARMRVAARALEITAASVANLSRQDLAWIGEGDWSPSWQTTVLTAASDTAHAARELENALAGVGELLNETVGSDAQTLSALGQLAEALSAAHGLDLSLAFAVDHATVTTATRAALASLKSYRSDEATLSTTYAREACRTTAIDTLQSRWAAAQRRVWPLSSLARIAVRRDLRAAGGCANTPAPEQDLSILRRMLRELTTLDDLESRSRRVAGWAGLDTREIDVESALGAVAKSAAAISRLARSPDELIAFKKAVRALVVDGNDLLAEGMSAHRILETYCQKHAAYTIALGRFQAAAKSPENLAGAANLKNVREAMEGMLAVRPSINAWCGWVRARDQALDLDLAPLVQALEAGALNGAGAVGAFEVGFAAWLAQTVIDREPLLRRFVPAMHEAKIDDFRKLDDTLAELSSRAIRALLSDRIPRKDDRRLPSNYGALKYQLSLKVPRKALRQLAQDMGDALTTLTPCLLMSPLSVAQYLPAHADLFDLVIFDEASQITPWDAIGAIARGRQVIVAGDPKQMPPTNFFNRGGGADDDDEGTDEPDQESVLEQCLSASVPQHRLTWHYRSRHESLIAFSNERYYEGELVTFPAAVTAKSAVSFVKVEGLYARGKARTNAEEAKAIVAEVVRRLRDPKFVDETGNRLTLGVVTLNSEQQRLIEDLLDSERRKWPQIEPYFDDALAEPVIVKNLETVQGDERDLIILGVGFGPHTPGAADMSMNFGPLNKDGGWRRWNVAITRARRETMLFASFAPSMIDINRSRARAVKDLRDYQDFAIRGPQALAQADHGSVGGFDSPFEQAVARGLRDKGWNVVTQVGVSRFRVDLGVVHPDRPGEYLAGVECDGATYHRAATARDRDKVREGILRGLGWELLRVWSTDWWIDKTSALEKLDGHLRSRLEASRQTCEERDRASVDRFPAHETMTLPDEGATGLGQSARPEPAASRPSPIAADPNLDRGARFRRADLSRFDGVLRPDLFYDRSYDQTLHELTSYVVKVEAPLRDDILVERIARAHGFQRAGRLIRERILLLKGRRFSRWTDPAGGKFVWPDASTRQQWSTFRLPASDDDVRSIDDICSEELRAGGDSLLADDVPWELSRQLGIGRLSASARQRIEKALKGR